MEKRTRKKPVSPEIIAFGLHIQSIIKKKKLKTREVAYHADMEVENLRKYLKGKQEMRIGTLLRIAKALDIKASVLLDFPMQ